MKRAYHDKILNNFDAIDKRTKVLREIADGKRNGATSQDANKLLKEIDTLVNSARQLVDLVPTE